jgi:hypothetical protein
VGRGIGGGTRNAYKVFVGKSEGERDHLGDTDIDRSIILKWVFRDSIDLNTRVL